MHKGQGNCLLCESDAFTLFPGWMGRSASSGRLGGAAATWQLGGAAATRLWRGLWAASWAVWAAAWAVGRTTPR